MCKQDKLHLFLSLNDFDEYMDRYEELVGLQIGPEAFRKEMQLMETDQKYTHRKKDSIRQARKRREMTVIRQQIEMLRDESSAAGCWIPVEAAEPDVTVTYQYPHGKNGDIDNEIAHQFGNPEQTGDDTFVITIPAREYEIIELLCFLSRSVFAHYDYLNMDMDAPALFLAKYNRIFQIERLMWRLNYYDPKEYRNLRSVGDLVLRKILQEYHGRISQKRDGLYERLIAGGSTNARWISEQKAYAIVREIYPDALFQYEPEWLHGQHLDIFIPSRNTAIEYQGRQHTEAIDFFGGEQGLKDNRRRDRKKSFLCRQNGVKLLYWDYSEPLTKEYFLQNINSKITDECPMPDAIARKKRSRPGSFCDSSMTVLQLYI